MKLADNLSYGSEMLYDSTDFYGRLTPYITMGLSKKQINLGIKGTDLDSASSGSQYIKDNDYAGIMVYDVAAGQSDFVSSIANILFPDSSHIKTRLS